MSYFYAIWVLIPQIKKYDNLDDNLFLLCFEFVLLLCKINIIKKNWN